jgi:multiple sugar transport system permease protein
MGVQLACIAVTVFMTLPIVLIALAAVSSRDALNEFPKPLFLADSLPRHHMRRPT